MNPDMIKLHIALDRARTVLNKWNEDHPRRFVPWEWVEELVIARDEWMAIQAKPLSPKDTDVLARFTEFRKKVPNGLWMLLET